MKKLLSTILLTASFLSSNGAVAANLDNDYYKNAVEQAEKGDPKGYFSAYEAYNNPESVFFNPEKGETLKVKMISFWRSIGNEELAQKWIKTVEDARQRHYQYFSLLDI